MFVLKAGTENLIRLCGGGEPKGNRSTILEDGIPTLVTSIYEKNESDTPFYDAILVDEGQDYTLKWWNSLQKALKPGGEMLLVADKTQNLYEREQSWTDQANDWGRF